MAALFFLYSRACFPTNPTLVIYSYMYGPQMKEPISA